MAGPGRVVSSRDLPLKGSRDPLVEDRLWR